MISLQCYPFAAVYTSWTVHTNIHRSWHLMTCLVWSVLLYFNYCILLVFKNMEYKGMQGINNIKSTRCFLFLHSSNTFTWMKLIVIRNKFCYKRFSLFFLHSTFQFFLSVSVPSLNFSIIRYLTRIQLCNPYTFLSTNNGMSKPWSSYKW